METRRRACVYFWMCVFYGKLFVLLMAAQHESVGLVAAAFVGDTNTVATLLESGIPVDSIFGASPKRLPWPEGAEVRSDASSWTPLLAAAASPVCSNRVATCRQLIRAGANVNAQSSDGANVLWFAASSFHRDLPGGRDLLTLLLEQENLNPNPPQRLGIDRYGGMTPLHLVVSDATLTDKLIRAGANVNQPDDRGRTPLFLAVAKGFADSVRLLLEAGASVDYASEGGKKGEPKMPPALFVAVSRKDLYAVRLLLKYGANPHLTWCGIGVAELRAHDKTPKSRAVLKLLREAGQEEMEGSTPLNNSTNSISNNLLPTKLKR